MRNIAAVIAPEVNEAEQARREISKLYVSLCDAERANESASQQRLKRLLALGERLILERSRHPSRGPKAKSWGALLCDCGIEQPRAYEAMKYAGYVEKVSSESDETPETLPDLREAGIDKKPRKSEERERDTEESESEEPECSRSWDADRFLLKLHDQLIRAAEGCPIEHRLSMAAQLRNIAKIVEGMQ